MAKRSGLSQQFFAHGYDLSGDVGAVNSIVVSRADLDVTALNKTAHERLGGVADGTIDFTAFFNDAAGQEHAALKGMPSTSVMWSWLMAGADSGGVGLSGTVQQMNYSSTRGRNGSMEMGAKGSARDGYPPIEEHTNVSPGKVTHASATSSASADAGAGTTRGGIGFLQYFSRASGTPSFLIEHSTDNAAWSTLMTFAGTGGVTAFGERKTVTGTVNRYLRATTTGTFTTAIFWIGFRRGLTGDLVDYS